MPASSVARFVIIAALVSAPAVGAAQAQTNQLAANMTNQNSATASAPAIAQPTAAAPKTVCKKIDQSYTRMPKRVCRTKEEWQRIETDAQ